MLPGHSAKTNIGVFFGLVAAGVIYFEPLGALPATYNYVIAGLGLLAHGWACFSYVTGKGQSPFLTLIGVIPLAIFLSGVIPGYHPPAGSIVLIPIGLLILVILPDTTVSGRRSGRPFNRWTDEATSTRWASGEKRNVMGTVLAVVAGLGLLIVGGWTVYRHNHPATVADAQRMALERYPELGIRDSALNREFVARYNRAQATNKAFFNDTGWPLKLASESKDAVDQAQAKR